MNKGTTDAPGPINSLGMFILFIVMPIVVGIRNVINWVQDNPDTALLILLAFAGAVYGVFWLRRMTTSRNTHWSRRGRTAVTDEPSPETTKPRRPWENR